MNVDVPAKTSAAREKVPPTIRALVEKRDLDRSLQQEGEELQVPLIEKMNLAVGNRRLTRETDHILQTAENLQTKKDLHTPKETVHLLRDVDHHSQGK